MTGEEVLSNTGLMPMPPEGKPRIGRPPKSGAYSGSALLPLMNEKKAEILEVLRGHKVAIGPTDTVAVGLLARALAHIELIDRYLATTGFFETDAETGKMVPAPVLRLYYVALNSASRQCDALGLTPKSRIALGMVLMQAEDLAGRMSDERAREEE